MAKRLTIADIRPLSLALREVRAKVGTTQAEMAEALEISRKTYLLYETSRWYPPYKARARMITRLHDLEPSLVPVFLSVTGETLAEHVLTVQVQAPTARALSADAVKAAYDVAIAEVAAERDMTVGATRKAAASLLKRLAEAKVTLDAALLAAQASG